MNPDISKHIKSMHDVWEKFDLSKKLGLEEALASADGAAAKAAAVAAAKKFKNTLNSASSLTKITTGAIGGLGEYHFPPELIGGCCPRVVGQEEEIAWNSAADACDSERIHIVWQSLDNKIWYLAVRSSEMASYANSWCPFASLLPGMKDAGPPSACYTYFGDEMATMMVLTPDSLQIYRGTTLVVRAKAERSARELGNIPVIELVPDKIAQMTPVPWYSLSLFEDRARRVLAAMAVFVALVLAGLTFFIWLAASMSLITSRHDMSAAEERTKTKMIDLMRITEKVRTSPMRDQVSKFADVNDGLLAINGFLEVYEIKDGKTRWRAIIPTNVTADRINQLGGRTIETTPQGVAIGNAAEIEYEAAAARKK